jgi:hypothetical protein
MKILLLAGLSLPFIVSFLSILGVIFMFFLFRFLWKGFKALNKTINQKNNE